MRTEEDSLGLPPPGSEETVQSWVPVALQVLWTTRLLEGARSSSQGGSACPPPTEMSIITVISGEISGDRWPPVNSENANSPEGMSSAPACAAGFRDMGLCHQAGSPGTLSPVWLP